MKTTERCILDNVREILRTEHLHSVTEKAREAMAKVADLSEKLCEAECRISAQATAAKEIKFLKEGRRIFERDIAALSITLDTRVEEIARHVATEHRLAARIIGLQDELREATRSTRTMEEDRDLKGYKALCIWWDRVAKAVFGDVDDVDDDMLFDEITKLAEYRDVDCG